MATSSDELVPSPAEGGRPKSIIRTSLTIGGLLVCALIVFVLGSVAMSVLSPVRGSRRVVCLANLQQLGAAISMYEQDHDGFVPTWCAAPYSTSAPGNPASAAGTWDVNIAPYLRSMQLLTCISNPYGRDPATGKPFRSYAMAQYTQMVTGSGTSMVVRGCNTYRIPAPSRTVLLFEKGQQLPGVWGDALGQNVFQSHHEDFSRSKPTNPADGQPFHFSGKNFLYIDGHVKFATTNQYPFTWDSDRTAASPGDIWPSSFANWQGPGICAVAARQDDGGDWPLPE